MYIYTVQTVNTTAVSSILNRGNEILKKNHFLAQKRGVQFRHSTCNVQNLARKWGMEDLNTVFPYM